MPPTGWAAAERRRPGPDGSPPCGRIESIVQAPSTNLLPLHSFSSTRHEGPKGLSPSASWDTSLGLDVGGVPAVSAPWREWLTVESVTVVDGCDPGWLEESDVPGASYVAAVSKRWQFWSQCGR